MSLGLNGFIFFLQQGGIFIWIILFIFLIALSILLERMKKLYKTYSIDTPSFMNEVQKYVIANDISGAMRICSSSNSLIAKIFMNGLKRANSETNQIENAIKAGQMEAVSLIEKRIHWIAYLANIIIAVAVIGALQGLMQTYNGLSLADAGLKQELIGNGITKSIHISTFAIFLVLVIYIMNAFVVSKANDLIHKINEYSSKLIDLMDTKNKTVSSMLDQL